MGPDPATITQQQLVGPENSSVTLGLSRPLSDPIDPGELEVTMYSKYLSFEFRDRLQAKARQAEAVGALWRGGELDGP